MHGCREWLIPSSNKIVDMMCSGWFHQIQGFSVTLGKPESIEVISSSSGKKKETEKEQRLD